MPCIYINHQYQTWDENVVKHQQEGEDGVGELHPVPRPEGEGRKGHQHRPDVPADLDDAAGQPAPTLHGHLHQNDERERPDQVHGTFKKFQWRII